MNLPAYFTVRVNFVRRQLLLQLQLNQIFSNGMYSWPAYCFKKERQWAEVDGADWTGEVAGEVNILRQLLARTRNKPTEERRCRLHVILFYHSPVQ